MTQETPKKTAEKRSKTGGRQKGTLNKTTATAKENIIAVFTRLGGTAAMAKWAKSNQDEFYKLYARLIPIDIVPQSPDGGPLRVIVEGVPSKAAAAARALN